MTFRFLYSAIKHTRHSYVTNNYMASRFHTSNTHPYTSHHRHKTYLLPSYHKPKRIYSRSRTLLHTYSHVQIPSTNT